MARRVDIAGFCDELRSFGRIPLLVKGKNVEAQQERKLAKQMVRAMRQLPLSLQQIKEIRALKSSAEQKQVMRKLIRGVQGFGRAPLQARPATEAKQRERSLAYKLALAKKRSIEASGQLDASPLPCQS